MNAYTVVLIAAIAIAIRIGLYFLDKKKVQAAAERKGWKNIEITWAPFAPGWFFEKGERHYKVLYADDQDRWQEVYCKTSLLTGVYWRDANS
jgi:hypothetical protein